MMAGGSEITLHIRCAVEVGGLQGYTDTLRKWNEKGIIDYNAEDISSSAATSDISRYQFHRDSLDVQSKDGYTTLKFRSDCMEFELTGTKVIRIDEYTYCSTYGTLYDDIMSGLGTTHDEIATSLLALNGAFALVCVSFRTNSVYVLKDEIGIKSLLISFNGSTITIANRAKSVDQEWYELPPYFLTTINHDIATIKRSNLTLLQICEKQRLSHCSVTSERVNVAINMIDDALCRAVKHACSMRSVKGCVTILFSGGLDSALIARIVAEHVSDLQYIELINVAFQPKRAPDRITAICTYEELIHLYPRVEFRLICVDVDTEEYKKIEPYLFNLIFPNTTHMDLNIAAALHYAVTRSGYILNPRVLETKQWKKIKNSNTIMKSVNLRVTIAKTPESQLAAINNGHGNKSDLESLGIGQIEKSTSDDESDAIPRYWDELKSACEIRTTLEDGSTKYVSQSRVVLIGSGADEIFGGYGRHAVERKTDAPLAEHEINKDLLRLWKRNLGRDDRVVNEQGVTAVYPFLDKQLLNTIKELEINPASCMDALACEEWFKALGVHKSLKYDTLKYCEFLNGEHDKHISIYVNKWLLREIALRKGLNACVHFKKRAIQFGSRSAKTFNVLRGMSNRVASDKGAVVLQLHDV